METQNTYDVRIHTAKHRVLGTLYVPPNRSTDRFLNEDTGGVVIITEPRIYTPGVSYPDEQELRVSAGFLGVHIEQVTWLVGGPLVEASHDVPLSATRFALLFDSHILLGHLRFDRQLRSSDFIRSSTTFQTLYQAALYPWQQSDGRLLLLGDSGERLFEVNTYSNVQTPVTELTALERFNYVTVNLQQTSGILEAPNSSPNRLKVVTLEQT